MTLLVSKFHPEDKPLRASPASVRRGALRRLVLALEPSAVARGMLPASAGMLLHVLDEGWPPPDDERGGRWTAVLQGHLLEAGIDVVALDQPLTSVAEALHAIGDAGTDADARWTWLLSELEHL